VIEKGLAKFDKCVERARSTGADRISGEDAFDLHQTDGFLIELTEAMAAKKNLAIDLEDFKRLMNQLQGRKRQRLLPRIGDGRGPARRGPQDGPARPSFWDTNRSRRRARSSASSPRSSSFDQLEEVGHATPVAVILDRTPF